METNRVLVKAGVVYVGEIYNNKIVANSRKIRYLMLFSDIMVFCTAKNKLSFNDHSNASNNLDIFADSNDNSSPKINDGELYYLYSLDVARCEMEDICDEYDWISVKNIVEHAFKIKHPNMSLYVQTKDSAQKSSWMENLDKVFDQRLQAQRLEEKNSENGHTNEGDSKNYNPNLEKEKAEEIYLVIKSRCNNSM